jgi:hypothetical protein
LTPKGGARIGCRVYRIKEIGIVLIDRIPMMPYRPKASNIAHALPMPFIAVNPYNIRILFPHSHTLWFIPEATHNDPNAAIGVME